MNIKEAKVFEILANNYGLTLVQGRHQVEGVVLVMEVAKVMEAVEALLALLCMPLNKGVNKHMH